VGRRVGEARGVRGPPARRAHHVLEGQRLDLPRARGEAHGDLVPGAVLAQDLVGPRLRGFQLRRGAGAELVFHGQVERGDGGVEPAELLVEEPVQRGRVGEARGRIELAAPARQGRGDLRLRERRAELHRALPLGAQPHEIELERRDPLRQRARRRRGRGVAERGGERRHLALTLADGAHAAGVGERRHPTHAQLDRALRERLGQRHAAAHDGAARVDDHALDAAFAGDDGGAHGRATIAEATSTRRAVTRARACGRAPGWNRDSASAPTRTGSVRGSGRCWSPR
jgi:hypothetical protein